MTQSPSSNTQPEETKKSGHTKWLLPAIAVSIVLGALVGGFFPGVASSVEFLGDAFLNALKMIVVPLVLLSIIMGVAGMGNLGEVGTMGWRTVAFYFSTTALAVLLGIVLVNVIRPGAGVDQSESYAEASYALSGDNNRTVTLNDTSWQKPQYDSEQEVVLEDQGVRGTVASFEDGAITVDQWRLIEDESVTYVTTESGMFGVEVEESSNVVAVQPELNTEGTGVAIQRTLSDNVRGSTERNVGGTLTELLVGSEERQGLIPSNIFAAMANTELLPIISFSLLLGIALVAIGDAGKPGIRGISALNDAVMLLVGWIVMLAPIGIFGIVAARVGDAGGFSGFLPELVAVGRYSLTVILGLALHGFVVLPLILWLVAKRNPIQYFQGMRTALLNAFATASSSATLPLTMNGVVHENNVSTRSANFVLPLGATINMDGTALYEAVAVIFIAQVYGIDLSLGQQVIVLLTATLAAIGAAGIPEAGLVTMVIVLQAVGLPIEGIGLLLAVDWLLDRFRTTINVWGDSIGAGVIETLEFGAPTPSPAAGGEQPAAA